MKIKSFFSKIPKIIWTITSLSAVAAINYSIINSPLVLLAIFVIFAHELAHYYTAKLYTSDVTPPIFLPLPFILLAFVKAKGLSHKHKMKVSLAGPLTGFIVLSLIILLNSIYTFVSQIPLITMLLAELVFNYFGIDGKKYRTAKRNIHASTISPIYS